MIYRMSFSSAAWADDAVIQDKQLDELKAILDRFGPTYLDPFEGFSRIQQANG
jgi:hypothetical protein